ncbi:AAA family ATPase [Agromyces sp. G08B096]|uniref:AAA family ATPase n=1 Tax=Agromyces sp. G08B096 TaxID=3156399 RepID=A0AAU7W454_9MICO
MEQEGALRQADRAGGPAVDERAASPDRGPLVSRARIIERARRAASIVAITAPAGYGKSTLLREWAGSEDRPAVSLTLRPFDNEPSALLSALATAFAAAVPEVDTFMTIAEQPAVGTAVLGQMAPKLAVAISRVPDPFVLMIDDVHEASADGCQDVLEVALARIPAGSQVVLASRQTQPFLGRLRPTGDVLEIGAADLRLDAAGARQVFVRLGAAGLSDVDFDRLLERTEGWPTGVALAALVAREGGDPVGVVGDDQTIAEYLYRACFARLDESDREFLRRTAIFDEVIAACSDAVLGRVDSKATLHDLESRGLFLVAVDRRQGRYRYHQLFREFLLGELEREEAGHEAQLHQDAAAWYETHEMMSHAIDHLLAGGEHERSVRLVAERAQSAYQAGDIAAIERWMTELGETAICSYPPLVVLAGLRAVLDGHAAEADHWANLLERMDDDRPAELGLPTLASGRAMLRAIMWRDGLESALRDATYGVSCEPPSSAWRDQALHLLGWALQLSGDVEGAVAAYEESVRQAMLFGNADSILLSEAELAIIELDAGSLDAAGAHAERALDVIDASGLHGYLTTCLALAVSARIALRRRETARAERLLARAMRDRVLCTYVTPVFAIKVRIELSRAYITLGNTATAAHLLHEIEELQRLRPAIGTLADVVDDVRASLDKSRALLGGSPLTPAELRLVPYLQTHLTISEIADRLFVTRNTVSSQVGSIYRKLQVTTRSAAVERAAEIGLLG